VDEIRRNFKDRSDATLIGFWNEGSGTLSWGIALEEELRTRGFKPRDENNQPRNIPIVGNKETSYADGARNT